MKIIGITGGIGAGKTTVSERFKKRGVDVIDCDIIARNVTASGSSCLNELVSAFGNDILNEDGSLNRAVLADKTFGSGDTKTLNKITHKYISLECKKIIDEKEKSGCKYIGIEASLLLDSDVKELCDYTLAVIADKEMRIKRVISRDNLSEDQVLSRIENQRDDIFFKKNASYCIYNNGDNKKLDSDVDDFLDNYIFGDKKLKKTKNKKNNRPPLLRVIALIITFLTLFGAVAYFLTSALESAKDKKEYRFDVYNEYIDKYSDMYNVQKLRIYSIIKCTSDFDPNFTSSEGKGLMRLSDSMFAYMSSLCGIEVREKDIFEPENNIRVGTFYLSTLIERFGDIDLAEAAYYLGESKVESWIEEIDNNGIKTDSNDKLKDIIKDDDGLQFVENVNYTFEKYVAIYPNQFSRLNINTGTLSHPVNLYKDYILLYSDAYESNFTETAVSGGGAVGLMQINKSGVEAIKKNFGDDIDEEILIDPELNIKYGTYYIRYLYDKFGSLNLAIAAYEAGEDNVIKWIQDSRYYNGKKIKNTPFVQINDYIKNIDLNREIYLRLYPEIFEAEEN